jgi:hypothetical protein
VGVEIPKRPLTLFTGVSGSGTSSLMFGTIAAAPAPATTALGSSSTARPPTWLPLAPPSLASTLAAYVRA